MKKVTESNTVIIINPKQPYDSCRQIYDLYFSYLCVVLSFFWIMIVSCQIHKEIQRSTSVSSLCQVRSIDTHSWNANAILFCVFVCFFLNLKQLETTFSYVVTSPEKCHQTTIPSFSLLFRFPAINPLNTTCSALTDTVSNQLLNRVEHLAATSSDISPQEFHVDEKQS